MRYIEFRVERRNVFLLASLAIASMALTTYAWLLRGVMWTVVPSALSMLLLYGVAAWMTVISLSGRWLAERRVLSDCRIVLASVEPAGKGLFHLPRVRYSFRDELGEYWGDTVQQFSRKFNDLELIFYIPGNPRFTVHASGLLFHKIVWSTPSAV